MCIEKWNDWPLYRLTALGILNNGLSVIISPCLITVPQVYSLIANLDLKNFFKEATLLGTFPLLSLFRLFAFNL